MPRAVSGRRDVRRVLRTVRNVERLVRSAPTAPPPRPGIRLASAGVTAGGASRPTVSVPRIPQPASAIAGRALRASHGCVGRPSSRCDVSSCCACEPRCGFVFGFTNRVSTNRLVVPRFRASAYRAAPRLRCRSVRGAASSRAWRCTAPFPSSAVARWSCGCSRATLLDSALVRQSRFLVSRSADGSFFYAVRVRGSVALPRHPCRLPGNARDRFPGCGASIRPGARAFHLLLRAPPR